MITTYISKLEMDGDDLVLPIPPQIIAELDLRSGVEVEVIWQLKNGIVYLKAKEK